MVADPESPSVPKPIERGPTQLDLKEETANEASDTLSPADPESSSVPKPIERVPTLLNLEEETPDTLSPVREPGYTRLTTPPSQIGRRHYREYGIRNASLLTIHRANSLYNRWANNEPPASPTVQRHVIPSIDEPEPSHDWVAEDHFIYKDDDGEDHVVYHSLTDIRGGFRQPPDDLADAKARKAWLEEEIYIVQELLDPMYVVCNACNRAVLPEDTSSNAKFDYVDEWVVHRDTCWEVLTKEDEYLLELKSDVKLASELSVEL